MYDYCVVLFAALLCTILGTASSASEKIDIDEVQSDDVRHPFSYDGDYEMLSSDSDTLQSNDVSPQTEYELRNPNAEVVNLSEDRPVISTSESLVSPESFGNSEATPIGSSPATSEDSAATSSHTRIIGSPEFSPAHLESVLPPTGFSFDTMYNAYYKDLANIRYFVGVTHILIPLIADAVHALARTRNSRNHILYFRLCRRLVFLQRVKSDYLLFRFNDMIALSEELLVIAKRVPMANSLDLTSILTTYGIEAQFVVMALSTIDYLKSLDLRSLRDDLREKFNTMSLSSNDFSECASFYESLSSEWSTPLNEEATPLLDGLDVASDAVQFGTDVRRRISRWSMDDLLSQKYNELSQRLLSSLPTNRGNHTALQAAMGTFVKIMSPMARSVDEYSSAIQQTLRDSQAIARNARRFGLTSLDCEVLMAREACLPFDIAFQLRHQIMEINTRLRGTQEVDAPIDN